jgi:hypothetical protein
MTTLITYAIVFFLMMLVIIGILWLTTPHYRTPQAPTYHIDTKGKNGHWN